MNPESIIPESLDGAARSRLADELVSRRAEILRNALRLPHDDPGAARNAALDTYFIALRALMAGNPERGLAHVAHWAPSFYVLYLLSTHVRDEGAAQAASNLFAMLLCERVGDGAAPVAGLRFRTRCSGAGELHVFSRDAAVRITGVDHPYADLEWDCGATLARVRAVDSTAHPVEIPLPLADATDGLEWRPFERVPGFDVPVLDDAWVAVLRSGTTPYRSTRGRDEEPGADKPLLSLPESVGAAYETLSQLLPDVVPWIALFVPAIVEVPPPAMPGARSSGSRLPGTPIHLSRVQDAFGHAEDLVHELQHARYQFLTPLDRYFGAFRGTRRETFLSPYRTDPRPLAGIHLGLHAFLEVTGLRLRAYAAGRRDNGFVRDLVRVHRMNVFSYRTIVGHDELSPDGSRVLAEIADALWEQHQAIEATVQPDVVASVEAELMAHRLRTLEASGTLENADVDFSAMRQAERRTHAVAAVRSRAAAVETRA